MDIIDYNEENDPLNDNRDLSHLKRTDKPRGYYAKILNADEEYISTPIKPEIFDKFESIEQINDVLERYLEKQTA